MNKKVFSILSLSLLITLSSCKIDNPLKDENGADIPIIKVDLPKYDGQYSLKFLSENGEEINETINVKITEAEHGLLIDDGGRFNNNSYSISSSLLGLNLNPNIKLDGSKNVRFVVQGESENYIVLPKVISHSIAGKINMDISTININPFTKSQARIADEYGIEVYSPESTLLEPIKSINKSHRGDGFRYTKLYRATADGVYSSKLGANQLIEYGLYPLNGSGASAEIATSLTLKKGDYFATVVRGSLQSAASLTLNIESNNSTSSNSLHYEIENSEGVVYAGTLTGTFPMRHTVENIFVSKSNPAVRVTLRANSTLTLDNEAVAINDITASNAVANFSAQIPSSTAFERYDVNVGVKCETNNQVLFSLSKTFEYSKIDPANPNLREWITGTMEAGRSSILMERDCKYEFRMLLNSKWNTYQMTTNPNDVEELLKDPHVNKYTINNGDGVTAIDCEVVSSQLCSVI